MNQDLAGDVSSAGSPQGRCAMGTIRSTKVQRNLASALDRLRALPRWFKVASLATIAGTALALGIVLAVVAVVMDAERLAPAAAAGATPPEIAYVSLDRNIRIWSPSETEPLSVTQDGVPLTSTPRWPSYAAPDWSPDGKTLAFYGLEAPPDLGDAGPSRVYLWESATGEDQDLTEGRTPNWSPDGSKIAYGGPPFFLGLGGGWRYSVYDLKTREILAIADSFGSEAPPEWSPDGEQIAFTTGPDPGIGVYDASTGELARTLAPGRGPVGSPVWSPDGKYVAVVTIGPYSGDSSPVQAVIIETSTDRETALAPELRRLGAVDWIFPKHWGVWSRDSAQLLYATADGTIWSWDAQTGESAQLLESGDASITSCCGSDLDLSADGRWLLYPSGSADAAEIVVYDLVNQAEFARFPGSSPVFRPEPTPTPTPTFTPELEVAKRYAPVLFFHPNECFFPIDVDHFFQSATLRRQVPVLADPPVDGWNHEGSFLSGENNKREYYLDVPGRAHETQWQEYCADYRATESTVTTYARIDDSRPDGDLVIQYWFFYYLNPFLALTHEGDWELVQLVFPDATLDDLSSDPSVTPEFVGLSQHLGAQRAEFGSPDVRSEDGTQPWVSVGLGSHANSFAPFSCAQVGGVDWRRPWVDSVRQDPEVKLITDEPWVDFLGLWGGEDSPDPPRSPSSQASWEEPIEWMGSNAGLCPGAGVALSIGAQSPVELHVYDDQGHHVGLDEDGEVQSEISGASYAEFEPTHAKMISVGGDELADSYEVRVQGTGDGNLTLSLQVVDDSGEYAALYESVPVTSATEGRLQVVGRRVANLEVDQDGDGDFESTVTPETFGTPDESSVPSDESGSGPSGILLVVIAAGGVLALTAGLGAGVWYIRKRRSSKTCA